MEWLNNFQSIAAPTFAAIVVYWLTGRAVASGSNARINEVSGNETAPRVETHQLRWHITHMRDDVSGIAQLLAITNALLAGILAALIF